MWEKLKAFFGFSSAQPKPDPKPDPEDKAAYDFVTEVTKHFEAEKEVYQVLKGAKKPSDVAKTFPAEEKAKEPAGYTWWVDVYEGPKGSGYQICFEVLRGAVTYRKVVNFGPEEWREQDWTEVKEVLLGPGI